MGMIEKQKERVKAFEAAAQVNELFDRAITELKIRSDAALCRSLGVAPPVISKMRHARLPVGDSMLIRLHEVLGWGIVDMKKELGLPSLAA